MIVTETSEGQQSILVLLGVLQAPRSGVHAETLSKHEKIDADCGHRCFISPEGRAALRKQSLRTVCLRCVERDAALRSRRATPVKGGLEGAARAAGVTPEQMEAATEAAVASMGGTYIREGQ